MDYLERFDRYKREHCEELSVKQKLRTGFKTKGQLKQGLSSFIRYVPDAEVEPSKLTALLFPDVRDQISIGVKVSSGAEQELAIYDDGEDNNALSERSYRFVSDSERSADSPPLSAVAEEERVGMETNVLIAQYEMGRLTDEEFRDALIAQRERFARFEEAPTGEVRVAGMEERVRVAPPLAPPRQPVRTMADLPRDEEGGEIPQIPARL
jgi:hypothetical protein